MIRRSDGVLAAGFVAFALAEESFIRMPGGWWPFVLAGCTALILVRRLIPLLAMLPHAFGPLNVFYAETVVAGERTVNFRLWQLVAMMIAAYTVGRCRPPLAGGNRSRGAIGVGLVLVTALCYWASGPGDPMGALFFPLAPYGLGVAVALQARRTVEAAAVRAEIRERQAREAVMDERVRIARELHDMVAHSVTVMVIQAGVVRRRLAAGLAVDPELLLGIEGSGRQAVGELRRTLGLLRGEGSDAPPSGLDRLDELIAQVREAGLAVAVRREGEPVALPPAVDLSAYRIVQEALTNVLKHAGTARAEVVVGYRADGLHLRVTDEGGTPAGPGEGGQGLIGMRERAALFGGELTAGPRDGGGFSVECRLPVATA